MKKWVHCYFIRMSHSLVLTFNKLMRAKWPGSRFPNAEAVTTGQGRGGEVQTTDLSNPAKGMGSDGQPPQFRLHLCWHQFCHCVKWVAPPSLHFRTGGGNNIPILGWLPKLNHSVSSYNGIGTDRHRMSPECWRSSWLSLLLLTVKYFYGRDLGI